MKIFLFACLVTLTFGQVVFAQESAQESRENKLLMFDESTNAVTAEPLDSEGLLMRAPPAHSPPAHNPPAHNPPGHNPPGHNPPGHNPPGHNPPPHQPPRPPPHPGPWRPYPGWHNGWTWNRGWVPGWYRVGMAPPWVWGDVPYGYWQCTAFNSSLQAFTRFGPDMNQAAYGALYACGGPNYQQMNCYIPNGYCQFR